MKILDRYILRQIWVPALLAAIVTSFVVVAGELQRQLRALFHDVPIAQVSMGDISSIALYAVPIFVGYIVPVTFLLGILLSFGRMAQHSEIIAMKAAGVPLKRIVLPVLLAGAVLSGVCFWVQDQGQPWAFQRMNQLLASDLPLRVRLDMLPTGVMHQYGDWRVYIGDRDEAGALHNIVVMRPQPGGRAETFYADTARLVRQSGEVALELRQGHYIRAEEDDRAQHITFDVLTETVPALPERKFERERKGSSLRELWADEQQLAQEYAATKNQVLKQSLLKYRVEIGNRFAFPLMCLAVALVAGPIGARAQRSGRSYTFASGLLIVVVYFLVRDLMAPNSLKDLWETILRMQAANVLLLLAGGVMLWRVDRI
jgi:LPS export ABC transporter permease LptF